MDINNKYWVYDSDDNDGLVWAFTTMRQARKEMDVIEKIVKYEVAK